LEELQPIFKADRIVVYSDNSDKEEVSLLVMYSLNEYAAQYLRKRYFIHGSSGNVGILPPLRTPHHPTGELIEGDYRQGIAHKTDKESTVVILVLIGLRSAQRKTKRNKVF